jgi:prepilin-type N-terminal cleavage/methylation domain-containing protein
MAANNGRHATRRCRSGFTLLELVIVLAILVALTTVAVRSLDGVEDQSRYDATRRSLDNIQTAVLGVPNERDADGSLLVTGFAADLGRLPHAQQIGNDPGTQLQELWNNPYGLQAFAINPAPDDPEVWLGTGWRGNYLRLSMSASSLTDGWGNPYNLLGADGVTPVGNGGEVDFVQSVGGASPYTSITMSLAGLLGQQPANAAYTATVSGCVYQLTSTGSGQLTNPDPTVSQVVVCYFGPNPNTGGILELPATVVSGSSSSVTTYSIPATTWPTIGPTIGPRVLRAYLFPLGTSPTLANLSSATMKSVPVRITLQAGGQVKDLVLH